MNDEAALRERLYAISRLIGPLTDTPDDNSLVAYAIQEIAQGVKTPVEAVTALGEDWADVLADLARDGGIASASAPRCHLGHRYSIVEGHGAASLKPIGQSVGSAAEAIEFMNATDRALDPQFHASHINGTACPEETARLTADYADDAS